MKRVVSAFFFLFITFHAVGQYGNEWISFGQLYFKIPVGSDGLYRIPYQNLVQAGFPASADPKTFQLFHRGVEQAILVQGEGDGVFNASDYVEFFGQRNDGTLDSTLYENSGHQPHRYYNLFSDTTSYFLTYGVGMGKRISAFSGSSDDLIPETYHRNEKIVILKESYSGGIDYGDIQQTTFDQGEGWTGVQIVQNQEVEYVLPGITETATAGGKPLLEVLLTGRGPMVHRVDLSTGTRFLTSISFPGYQSYKHTQDLEWSDIDATGNLTVKIKVSGVAGSDRVSAGYLRLIYPQQITMAGVTQRFFLLGANATNFSFIQIQNAGADTRLFDVTNPDEVVEIAGTFTTTVDAVLPTSTGRKIFASSEVKTPERITRVTFRNINPESHNYVIITHPLLRTPSSGYIDPVKAYAEYRALPEGGDFDTLIVNTDQLYDQFNFGERSPRAIFKFLKFLVSIKAPEYLFLIGKGLDVNYDYGRNPSAFPLYKDLVPTAGYPASDMAFTAGLSGIPAVATGRLTAISPAEVAAYFNKVKEREALPFNDLARKKILHLSGGIEEFEPVMFRNILQDYASVARGLYFGAAVQAIGKQSADIKLVNVAEEVNNGLGLITFFGHSAPNTTDFDIGMVSDPVMGYDNRGKYPFLLMNGCNAGSFFLNATIFGEDWIKATQKGAVGFIAHSSYGHLLSLQRYASTFYNVAFGDSAYIKKGVGRVQNEVAKRYVENFGTTPSSITQVQQMILLGDPAVKLFGAEKPDYSIDEEKISITSFNGEPVTAYSDSFLIRIPVRNFGIADERNIRIEVTRQFNDQPVVIYDTIITGILYSDTVSFFIRKKDDRGFGINVFSISVDADHFVDELNESNNAAVFEYFIPLNSTRNLYPYNYSIVKTQDVGLSFQYTDLNAAPREYLLEVDTASTFNSGFKKQFRILTTALGKQQVELLSVDTLVYYWRTKIAEPLESESKDWTVSSFTYIKNGPEGWAQVHFPQFEANATYGLVMDAPLRRIHYEETVSNVAIRTFSAAASKPLDSISVKINGVEFNLLNQGGDCRNNTINLIAFDRRSTQPYAGLYFKWYELLYEYGGRRLLCGREPYVINSFKPDELITGNQDDLSQYVDNIAGGDSVVLFSMGDAGFSQWPEQARQELASFGISFAQLDVLQNGDPVIIFGRKGSPPGSATVFRAPSPQASLEINRTIAGRFTSGTMSSVLIGPAQRWDELVVKYKEVEAVDDFSFSVLGIRENGIADTLKSAITSNEDLSFINAETYPHVKVVFRSTDDIDLTSVQLASWLVVYETVAEGLIFYRGPAAQQVVQEGQSLSVDFGFINVSEKTFADSLAVRYDLLNYSNTAPLPSVVRIKPPLPGDTTLFTLTFNTESKSGLNDVEVFVNPRLQKEKSYDNNVMVLKEHLNVLADEMNPVVEITFDGRHLEDNEFVSPHPEIRIRLWDENAFRLKKDTLGVNIFLAFPCESDECDFARINFSREDVSWEPASESSDFMALFSPGNLPDGTYTLRVEAGDASANPGGQTPYEIRFRVQHTPSVTVSSPYPNPFYLETSFDVMVTGEETSPYFYRLEVTSLNGMLVAEYSDDETGFHVGKNSITWDGTDAAGKSLPNGIYLYRFYISGDAEERTYYGKMALLR